VRVDDGCEPVFACHARRGPAVAARVAPGLSMITSTEPPAAAIARQALIATAAMRRAWLWSWKSSKTNEPTAVSPRRLSASASTTGSSGR
jgi:hypothetical protein